jgi:hypothetical protein
MQNLSRNVITTERSISVASVWVYDKLDIEFEC